MQFRPLYKDISIVSVGNVSRDVCNPLNLCKHSIITLDEINSIDDKEMRVGDDRVSFKTNTFELLCDSNRLQIRTEDITRSDQLSNITLSVLRLSEATPKAIGINASFRFSLDEVAFLRFCNRCFPLATFSPMADNALLLDLTFMDWNHQPDDGQPNAVYNINRRPDTLNNQKVVQISVNNHLAIRDGMNTATYYLSETSNIHSQFFAKCQQFIKGIQ